MVLWITAGIICLAAGIIISIQLPFVQRIIVQKAAAVLSERSGRRIEIGSIDIAFTHSVVIGNIFIADGGTDTLLSVRSIAVDVNLLGLISNELILTNVRIDSLTAHIRRTLVNASTHRTDSNDNFSDIIDALSGDTVDADIPSDTSVGPPFTIRIDEVHLSNISATLDDAVSGMNARIRLGELHLFADRFDIDSMKFHLRDISIANTSAVITQYNVSPPDTSASSDIDIGFGTLSASNIQFLYENCVTGDRYHADLGLASVMAERVDLPSHRMIIKSILLENTAVAVVQSSGGPSRTDRPESDAVPWEFSLAQLVIVNTGVQFDLRGTPRMQGVDLNHLRADDLTMKANGLFLSNERMTAEFIHTSFRERSGFVLREFSGGILIDSVHAQLTDLTVETPASRIHQNTVLSYASISDLKQFTGNIAVRMAVDGSSLAASDILFFQPSLPLKERSSALFSVTADIGGQIGALNIVKLHVGTGDSTVLDLSGTIAGLPQTDSMLFNITLHQFSTTPHDLHSIVKDSILPASITIPAAVNISGRFTGTLDTFTASAVLASSIGGVKAAAEMNGANASRSARWKARVLVTGFDLGALMNDTSMFGPVTLNASADGMGSVMDELTAAVNITVDTAVVNGYPYKNLTIAGRASPTMFNGTAEIRDSNIAFTFRGSIDGGESHPAARFTLELQGMDLHRLNFTDDDVRVAGSIFSDIAGTDINDLNGTAGIRNVVIVKKNKRYTVDSLMYASVIVDDSTHISLESTILQARFDGTVTPGKLLDVFKHHFAHYFGSQHLAHADTSAPQSFTFHLSLRDPSTLTDIFVPDLHELTGGTLDGSFDSGTKDLRITADLPSMKYGNASIDSLTLSVVSDAGGMSAAVKVHSIADSTFHLTNLLLSGSAARDTLHVSLRSSRDDGFIKMLLAGVMTSDAEGYSLRVEKDGMVLRNSPWSVPSHNVLRFGKGRFIAENIVLSGGGQSLSVQSEQTKDKRPPLNITFHDFDLSALSQAVERTEGLFGGTLQGDAVLHFSERQTAFTSDLRINALSFRRMVLGDVALQADNRTEDVYNVKMDISGSGNQIALNGKYRSFIGGSELDLKLDLAAVNLAVIEPFTFGAVTQLSGTMSGGFTITGTLKHPSVNGELNFANTAFNPSVMDTYLHLDHGTVIVNNSGIEFRSFDLTDTRGKRASLSGTVLSNDLFTTFRYNLRAHTDDFLVLNKAADRDALYYGTVILDSDISITGDQQKQTVIIRAELDKGTNLALVLPESEAAAEERRGIVRFTQKDIPQHDILSRMKGGTDSDTAESDRSTVELTSNITVTKDSKLRILIDPVAGDSLVIRGEAALSFTIDPGGKITLTGRYEITEGSYQLSFGDFIKREFAIAQGSSLTWLGSPFDADVDITAVYTVKTSVMDLIQNQLGGISSEERNKYKQEIPIQVHLMMKGKLLTPDIHFKLDLPSDSRGVLNGSVYAKLNELNGQESELNKQVFALLVLGRFISENPLASAGGSDGLSDFARSSASQILSAQLNRLSQEYIKGVELNMGLESYKDYSTGSAEGRTQLQLALSKQLFNERVTVQAGGNVDLEGERSQKNSLNNFAGDLKVLYKLTDDGRWQLQVFRQNSYEGAIDGDITKTGAGVVFTLDFDTLFGPALSPVPK